MSTNPNPGERPALFIPNVGSIFLSQEQTIAVGKLLKSSSLPGHGILGVNGFNHPTAGLITAIQHIGELSHDFSELWKSKEFSDVEIHCAGGEVIRAHKAVLSARSRVFHAMFESGMQEALTSTVKIENISKNTLEKLFEYLYTGCLTVQADIDELSNILRAADMYQFERLKLSVLARLIHLLSLTTAGDIVVLAHTYNASDKIKYYIQKFLLEKRSELSMEESFQEMLKKHPPAFSEITYGIFDNK